MAAKKSAPRKKRESTVDPNETKRAKFVRLATARVNKAIKAIQQIGNLSGSAYEYGEEDLAKIKSGLAEASTQTLARFQPKARADGPAVTFQP